MTDLLQMKCVACRGDEPRLTDQEIAAAIIAHRKEHGTNGDVEKAHRKDYIGRTIGKARAKPAR